MCKRIFSSCIVLIAAAAAAWAQNYKLETENALPPVPAAYSTLLAEPGYRVAGPSGTWVEVWFRKALPSAPKPTDPSITLPIAQGTFLGIMRFPGNGADRRGQTIKPGVYTMRYSNFPVDGAHQGVAPQRDFALLTPIANDTDPAAMPDFDKLVNMSKTSGTNHPCVFSLEPPAGNSFPALTKEGDHDTVLNVKAGDLPVAIIVAGTVEG